MEITFAEYKELLYKSITIDVLLKLFNSNVYISEQQLVEILGTDEDVNKYKDKLQKEKEAYTE